MIAKRLRNFYDIYPYPIWPIDYGLTYPMQYPGYPLYPIFVVPKPDGRLFLCFVDRVEQRSLLRLVSSLTD